MYIEYVDKGVCAPKGFRASGVHVGFRKNKKKKDLALIVSDRICSSAAVYTQNKVRSAPIIVNREHLENGKARAIICNSGNANTCAPNGVQIARDTCKLAADALKIDEKDVIVCSTGVIGEPMYIEPFAIGIPKVVKKLAYDGSSAAAIAITTTDTAIKETAVSFVIGNKECFMGGIAKGSGMINPSMATMLAFITTDANIASDILREALKEDINHSFNQISIDGDTSTNDTVVIMANGKAGNRRITKIGRDFAVFAEALNVVTVALARMLAKDGEGATKLIECRVSNAPTDEIGMRVAKTVIQSDLVKTAMFGSDANWGRVLCAIGYTQGAFNTDNVDVVLASRKGSVTVCKSSLAVDFDEDKATEVLGEDEIEILINLHDGMAEAEAYGCDLTYAYVRINGMYRT
jgi:glutamate N-acetyltransferase/amino-acid N-acetyltransferase